MAPPVKLMPGHLRKSRSSATEHSGAEDSVQLLGSPRGPPGQYGPHNHRVAVGSDVPLFLPAGGRGGLRGWEGGPHG